VLETGLSKAVVMHAIKKRLEEIGKNNYFICALMVIFALLHNSVQTVFM